MYPFCNLTLELTFFFQRYCKDNLNLDVEVDDKISQRLAKKLSVEEYKTYRRGLDEITFNLQESQDFFDASLDGRLKQYQQLEKCMIEAQLKVVRKYSEETSGRKKLAEEELAKDLEYIRSHMEEDPKVTKHRENMKQIHRDFFAVLKWQRERITAIMLDDASSDAIHSILDADDAAIAALREEYKQEAEKKKLAEQNGEDEVIYHFKSHHDMTNIIIHRHQLHLPQSWK